MTCCIECVTASLCTAIYGEMNHVLGDCYKCKTCGVNTDFSWKLAVLKTQMLVFCVSTNINKGYMEEFSLKCHDNEHYTTKINNTENTRMR